MTERVKNQKIKRKYHESLGTGNKPNNFENSDGLDDVIARQLALEKSNRKYPLRINKQTVIFVSKEKCNEEYAEKYRKKIAASIKNGTAVSF